jgi:hypothetical protein
MKRSAYPLRKRRGITLVEVVMATGVALLVVGGMASVSRETNRMWQHSSATISAKQTLYLTAERLAPTLRAALRVDPSRSSTTRLTVILPRLDAGGNCILPLEDGDSYSFYLSDLTGSTGATGTVLWRAVNGVPDSAWSLRGGDAKVDLGTSGLSFGYLPSTDPERVELRISTTQSEGSLSVAHTATTEVYLRNRGLQ